MNNDLSNISDVFKKLNYPQASIDEIKSSGDKLVQNAKNWLLKHQKYNQYDSRVLAFKALKHARDGSVELLGIVTKCKMLFNSSYHQASLYVLLRYVCGFDYNNHLRYLTDHLWVDVNITSLESLHNLQIGIGDCLWIRGHVQAYKGLLHQMHGYKVSLSSDVHILQFGYPLFINNKFSGQIIPYSHNNYLYRTVGFDRHIFLGDEAPKEYQHKILFGHYVIGYSASGYLGKIIHQGLHLSTRKNNPKLVAKTSSLKSLNLINHIEWVHNHSNHDIILTSAKKLKQHPHIVESQINQMIGTHLQKSFDHELAWCRLHYIE